MRVSSLLKPQTLCDTLFHFNIKILNTLQYMYSLYRLLVYSYGTFSSPVHCHCMEKSSFFSTSFFPESYSMSVKHQQHESEEMTYSEFLGKAFL